MTSRDRLLSIRRLNKLTQEEIGRKLGVDRGLISNIELGRRPFSLDVTPLGFSPERFAVHASMSEPMHRARASTLRAARDCAKERLRLACEVFVELAADQDAMPVSRLPRIGDVPLSDVDEVAHEVRVGVLDAESLAPIGNLTEAVERAGVIVIPIRDLEGIGGLSSWVSLHGHTYPVVGLDPDVPGDRFRFSLLHELGHLVMHGPRRVPSNGPAPASSESEANRFARSVLLPEAVFDELFAGPTPTLRDFISLKQVWGISVAAMVYGAHELGYIDDQRYRSLQIQMSKWRRKEPLTFDISPGSLLPWLVASAGGVRAAAARLEMPAEYISDLIAWRQHLSVVREPTDGDTPSSATLRRA